MNLTPEDHRANAQDWLGMPGGPLETGETVDRAQLREQMQYTPADDEDVEEIARLIEDRKEEREWNGLKNTAEFSI